MKQILWIAVVTLSMFASQPATAGIVFFDNRADFEAAIGGAPSGFESFETPFVNAPSVDFPIGGTAEFSLSESGGPANGISSFTGSSGSNTDGSRVATYTDNGDSIANFDFVSPINVFGLDITLLALGTQTVTVGGDVSTSFDLLGDTPTFFGVINDMGGNFQQITFDVSEAEILHFDSIAYGLEDIGTNVVPEPSAIAIWGLLGLTVAGYSRWRRRK